jgi:AraC-like DNA-binding protein
MFESQRETLHRFLAGRRSKKRLITTSHLSCREHLNSDRLANSRRLGKLTANSVSIYTHAPGPPLGHYIERLWYYVDLQVDHEREHVLPNGSFELIINLEDRPRKLFDRNNLEKHTCFKRGWVAGVQTQYLLIDVLPRSTMIGAHFKPGGAAPFLGCPAGELGDRVVELDAIWGDNFWNWRQRLLEAPAPASKFAILEEFLRHRLAKDNFRRSGGKAVSWALEAFSQGAEVRRIGAVADAVGLSQKHFIETFRRQVGVTPKRFCRILRFQQALARMQSRKAVDWADVAIDCGYFDQAHFINEFIGFSGLNPSAYFRLQLEGDPNFVRAAT